MRHAGKHELIFLETANFSNCPLSHRLRFGIILWEKLDFANVFNYKDRGLLIDLWAKDFVEKNSTERNCRKGLMDRYIKRKNWEKSIQGKPEVKESHSKTIVEDGKNEFIRSESSYFKAFKSLRICFYNQKSFKRHGALIDSLPRWKLVKHIWNRAKCTGCIRVLTTSWFLFIKHLLHNGYTVRYIQLWSYAV